MLPGRPFAANWSASRSAPSPDPPAASTSAPRSPHRNAPSWPSYSSPTRPGSTSSPRRPQPSDQRKHPRLDTRRSCVPSRVPAGQPHNSRTIPRTQLRNPGCKAKADDANYWQLLGAKLLSVLLFAAAGTGRTMADVARWVDVQDVDDVATALMEIGNQQALDAWAACTSRPDNTMGSVY